MVEIGLPQSTIPMILKMKFSYCVNSMIKLCICILSIEYIVYFEYFECNSFAKKRQNTQKLKMNMTDKILILHDFLIFF